MYLYKVLGHDLHVAKPKALLLFVLVQQDWKLAGRSGYPRSQSHFNREHNQENTIS
jgi:hypothetical protein